MKTLLEWFAAVLSITIAVYVAKFRAAPWDAIGLYWGVVAVRNVISCKSE